MKKTGSFFSSISTKLMMLIIGVIFVLSACLVIICILFMGPHGPAARRL